MLEFYNQYQDLINSPFAFPRLPPRANQPKGITMAGKLKEKMIEDNSQIFGRLSDFYNMFQQYSNNLFNLASIPFGPGHPMYHVYSSHNSIQIENEKLKKENVALKKDLEKKK